MFKHVVDKVEGLYNHWFLGELGNNWSDVCADELATYGKVLEVPQQENFYRSRIQTSDTKVFVIISDAMRYEVAATMADQLQRETQSKGFYQQYAEYLPSIKVWYGSFVAAQRTDSRGSERYFDGFGRWSVYGKYL